MSAKFSDEEIAQMIQEQKQLPDNYRLRAQLRSKKGHKERELDVMGKSGTQYRLNFETEQF